MKTRLSAAIVGETGGVLDRAVASLLAGMFQLVPHNDDAAERHTAPYAYASDGRPRH